MLVPAVAMAGGAARSEWRGTAIRHSRKRVCARVDDDATSRDGSYVSTTSSSAAVVPVLIVGRSVRCRSLAYYRLRVACMGPAGARASASRIYRYTQSPAVLVMRGTYTLKPLTVRGGPRVRMRARARAGRAAMHAVALLI